MNYDKEILEEKANLLKVIGHPIRLCILRGLLREGKNNVSFMQECLNIPQSTLSQHLSKLRLVGIISDERKGTEVFYSVKNQEVINLIHLLFNHEEE